MTISRIGSAALQFNTSQNALRLQAHLTELQKQISSGKKTDNFEGLHGQVESFVQLSAKMGKTDNFVQNNISVLNRLQTTSGALDQVISLANKFQQLLTQRRNPVSQSSLQFDISARSMMQGIAEQLNTNVDGRYLFSGTRTAIKPVVDNVPTPNAYGVPDASYYQGNNGNITSEVMEGYDVTYNVRADAQGFQKLFGAINLGLKGAADNDYSTLAQATDMVNSAVTDIIATRASVQQNTVNITDINDQHEKLNLYWKGLKEKIINTDVVTASTEVATDQAILQAAFQSFAGISHLNLTDFLR